MNGCGCTKCSLELDNRRRTHYTSLSKTAKIYLIKVYNEKETFYKIGKTINKTKTRFMGSGKLPYNYEIISEYDSKIDEIYDLEIDLHRKYKNYKYEPNIRFNGYTECYNLLLPINEIINL
jgi:hypothetical protein